MVWRRVSYVVGSTTHNTIRSQNLHTNDANSDWSHQQNAKRHTEGLRVLRHWLLDDNCRCHEPVPWREFCFIVKYFNDFSCEILINKLFRRRPITNGTKNWLQLTESTWLWTRQKPSRQYTNHSFPQPL